MKSESTRTSFWLARDDDSCLSENGNNGKSVFIKDLTHPDQQTTFCWPALVIFCPELLDQLNRPSVAYPASCHQLTDNNANIKWVNVSFGLASRLTRNCCCCWCWCCWCWPIQNQTVVIKFYWMWSKKKLEHEALRPRCCCCQCGEIPISIITIQYPFRLDVANVGMVLSHTRLFSLTLP